MTFYVQLNFIENSFTIIFLRLTKQETFLPIFCRNTEALASEFLQNIEETYPWYNIRGVTYVV